MNSRNLFLRSDLALLWLAGLIVNGAVASFIARPGYMDAYYYFNGAVQLARGLGFNEFNVWNFLDPVRQWPHPSHLYWMPLTSMVAAPFVALAEYLAHTALPNPVLFRAAQIPFVLMASFLPLLGYAIALLTTGKRRPALAAALLTLFSAFYVSYWTTTDAFALYGLTAGSALLACGLARQRSSARWLFIAGLCAGLAHLTRADGALVLFIILFMAIVQSSEFRNQKPEAHPIITRHSPFVIHNFSFVIRHLLFVLAGYLLILLPWFIRNWLVMGFPLAPNGTRALWLIDYNDLYSFPADLLTPARYFASGWADIVGGKWEALRNGLGTFIGPLSSIVASPFILVGLWKLRRHALYLPSTIYAVCLFGLMTLAFSFPGMYGGLFHSGAALLPFFFSAAVIGLETTIDFAAQRLKHWKPERAKRVFAVALVGIAAGLSAVMVHQRVIGADWQNPAWNRGNAVYIDIGRWLDEAGETQAVVAVNNPPAFYYFTGHACIALPKGPPDTLLQAAAAYGARWVVLDKNNYAAGLGGLYDAPHGDPRLQLKATFDGPVYLFEIVN